MDIGSAVGRQKGLVTNDELRDVANWEHSSLFSESEKVAIEYAEAMSLTPVRVSDELFERVRKNFSEDQIVELTASVAYENYRARFNHALAIKSENYSELLNEEK